MGSNAEAGMEQLVQGLRSAYHERISGAADIRTATRQKLAELRTIRKAAAVQEQRQRAVYAEKLSQKVSTLRQATQAFLGQVAAEQEAISAAQRVQLDESAQALKQDVEALRQDVQRFVQELGAAQQVVARNQRQALTAGRAVLSAEVEEMLREAQTFVVMLDQAHQEVAEAQREWLTEERSVLATRVVSLRDRFQQELSLVRADQDKARKLWGDLVAPGGKAPAAAPAAAPIVAAPEAASAPEPVAAVPDEPVVDSRPEGGESSADDLTAIPGIGAAMQRRLVRSGIRTYAQLAASSPDAIRQCLGEIAQLAKVEEWIATAQGLAGAS